MPQTAQPEAISAEQVEALRATAADASRNAYAPYSRFHVGAAVLLVSGEVVTGCNVENVSYRLTCCAEQTAIARAVAEHGPGIRIAAVAVAVANADGSVACQPCGGCRQTIAEFADGDCRIFYPGEGGGAAECTLADLLPASFNISSLPQQI